MFGEEHDFQRSLAVRRAWRPKALAVCKQLFPVSIAARGDDRAVRLIDRFIDGDLQGVYFKVDTEALRTGHLFIETVRNTATGQPGWVWRTRAKWVLYYAAPGWAFLFLTKALREFVQGKPATLVAKNKGYRTLGVAMDLVSAWLLAERVVGV